MSPQEIEQRIDDIVYGLYTGVKYENHRFEQDKRVITRPEPLDPHEMKAEFIRLLSDLGIKL